MTIAVENTPNELGSPASLVQFVKETRLDLKFCFDIGHAHLDAGVAEGFELMRGARRHDAHSRQSRRERRTPVALRRHDRLGCCAWGVCERGGAVPLVLELKDQPGGGPALDQIRASSTSSKSTRRRKAFLRRRLGTGRRARKCAGGFETRPLQFLFMTDEQTKTPQNPIVAIEHAADYAGQTVTIRGWLYNLRESGKLLFPIFRDGTGIIQGVVSLKENPEGVWRAEGVDAGVERDRDRRDQGRAARAGRLRNSYRRGRDCPARAGIRSLSNSTEGARRRFPAGPAASVDSHAAAGVDFAHSRRGDSRRRGITWTIRATS